MTSKVKFELNGEIVEFDSTPYESLLQALRKKLGVKSCKRGCDYAGCGACTVIVDDLAIYSCSMPAERVNHKSVTTIEGLATGDKLHPIQENFVKHWGLQCGFCTPGMILSAKSLLDKNPNPSEDEIRDAIVGNLCTCTGYVKIVEAIIAAASDMREHMK